MGFRNSLTSNLSSPASWLVDWFRGGPESESGVSVTTDSSLGYATVWYAVSKIAGHVGQLPCNLMRWLDDGGSEHAISHPVYSLMKRRPNEYQTAITFKEQMMLHALLEGNGRAAILRRGGVPYELLPMLPYCTWTCIVDGKKWHICNANQSNQYDQLAGPDKLRDVIRWDHQEEGGIYKILDEDVVHIPGLGYDGISGRSLVSAAKDVLGLGLSGQKATSRSFKNGAKPSIVITAPPGMFREDAQAKEFLDNFNEYHEGSDNYGKAALVREGMTIQTIGMSANDAQWVENRQMSNKDIAMLFGLESLPGDDDSVSYNSLEQKNQAYLSNCLMRWLVKWEQECDHKLLGRNSRNHYFKFNVAALLRPDFKTTVEALGLAITHRIMNPNEAREKIDMNPYDGGDAFENPAITPGSTGEESESVEDVNNSAVAAHFRHLIQTEANRVLFAAGNKGNYLAWVDKFYDGWQPKLADAIRQFGGDPELADEHCDQSQMELMELTGTVGPDGLAAAIEELVTLWPERADTLANQVTKGLSHVT